MLSFKAKHSAKSKKHTSTDCFCYNLPITEKHVSIKNNQIQLLKNSKTI